MRMAVFFHDCSKNHSDGLASADFASDEGAYLKSFQKPRATSPEAPNTSSVGGRVSLPRIAKEGQKVGSRSYHGGFSTQSYMLSILQILGCLHPSRYLAIRRFKFSMNTSSAHGTKGFCLSSACNDYNRARSHTPSCSTLGIFLQTHMETHTAPFQRGVIYNGAPFQVPWFWGGCLCNAPKTSAPALPRNFAHGSGGCCNVGAGCQKLVASVIPICGI